MNDPDSIRCWREADDGLRTRLYYNIINAEWNCTEHYGNCDSCPKSQSDPDIAGIGVIIAFMFSVISTACLSVAFAILSTVQPRKCTVRATMAYAWVGKIVAQIIGRKHAVRCAKICYDMVICLGDQQLVGSVALLVATIIKLHFHKTLSVYHFELVLVMVSLSSTAFTYAMICYRLRHQWDSKDDGCTRRLRHQQHGPHPWSKRLIEGLPWAIRIFFRLCLVVLLLYNILVAARMKDLPWDCPAICFKNNPGYDWKSAILPPLIMLLFAIQSSITDFIQLALAHNSWDPKAYLALLSNKKQRLLTWFRHQRDSTQETRRSISLPSPSLHQGCFYILDGLFIVLWLSITHYFGSLPMVTGWFVSLFNVTLYAWRRTHIQVSESLRRLEAETKEEMEMGFGQTVVVILLVLLLVQLVISISVHYGETNNTTPNSGSNDFIMNINVNVDITDDTEEIINQPTGTPSAGQYPWGPL